MKAKPNCPFIDTDFCGIIKFGVLCPELSVFMYGGRNGKR